MKNFINHYRFILINLFLLALFASILFATPNLIGSDVFYHLKITELIQANRLQTINELPWLQFSTWSQFPADLSLGFHLLLYPFLLFFSPITAIKIFTIILLLILINLFLFFINKLKIKFPFFWLLLLLFISPLFFLRLLIFRPFIISIILSLLVLYGLHRKKYWIIFIASIIYGLSYSSWLQLFIIIIFYTLAELFVLKKINLKYLLYSLIPIAGILILRPDFPNIIVLTFQQIFGVLYLKLFQPGINFAIELNSASEFFVIDHILLFILLLLDIIFIYIYKNFLDNSKKILIYTLLTLSIFYLFWTFLSTRFVEYLVPFSILLTAFCFSLFINRSKSEEFNILINNLKLLLQKPILKIIIFLAFISIILIPIKRVDYQFQNIDSLSQFQETSEWLKNNTPAESTIFHASWDSFPRLFFHNHHNYYLIGMDPAFMYLYNKDLYWLWRNITERSIACTVPTDLIDINNLTTSNCLTNQQTPKFISQTIKTQFNSEYIWINQYGQYQDFKKFLEANLEFFVKMIETDDSSVFKIK